MQNPHNFRPFSRKIWGNQEHESFQSGNGQLQLQFWMFNCWWHRIIVHRYVLCCGIFDLKKQNLDLWRIFAESLENHWRIFGESLKNLWRIFEESLENLWRIFAESFQNLCRIFGESLQNLEMLSNIWILQQFWTVSCWKLNNQRHIIVHWDRTIVCLRKESLSFSSGCLAAAAAATDQEHFRSRSGLLSASNMQMCCKRLTDSAEICRTSIILLQLVVDKR